MTTMQGSSLVDRTNGGTQFSASEGVINGSHVSGQIVYGATLGHGGVGPKLTMEQVDVSQLDHPDDDSDSDMDGVGGGMAPHVLQPSGGMGLKPGKKTKGRVKIKMEFIENKLRRYTTFSKRKTGIMKKAYELSTLTGTQVMLLVASETGHVYTFATRKLQPMITSESGKALIQTCLNSPDPPPVAPGQQQAMEQRMNPTGFEETELTYAVSEDEGKIEPSGLKPVYAITNLSAAGGEPGLIQNANSTQGIQIAAVHSQGIPTTAYLSPVTSTPAQAATTTTSSAKPQNAVSLQLPNIPQGVTAYLQPGAPITIPFQQAGQGGTTQAQTIYRLPSNGQLVSLASINPSGTTEATTQQQPANSSPSSISLVSAGTTQAGGTPGLVMYQTPQGIVYAPTTATLQDRSIFNFTQPATALSLPQTDQPGGGQQIITIPVPVSLASGGQVLHLAPADTCVSPELSQPTPSKKSRKGIH